LLAINVQALTLHRLHPNTPEKQPKAVLQAPPSIDEFNALTVLQKPLIIFEFALALHILLQYPPLIVEQGLLLKLQSPLNILELLAEAMQLQLPPPIIEEADELSMQLLDPEPIKEQFEVILLQ
jgi:hypothetical protein